MTPPDSIIHDLQMFVALWKKELEQFNIMRDYLNKKYNIKDIDSCDEYYYYFSLNGIKYSWNWLSEELYFYEHEENENSIISGPAYEYVRNYNEAISTAYKNVESEMRYRGWIYDHDEYCHNLFKDGWMTDLAYWSGDSDFDDAVGEIKYVEDFL